MKKVYLSRNYKSVHSAGGKAKTDVEVILQEAGYINLGFKQTRYRNKLIDFYLNLAGVLKAVLYMPVEGVLFLQYPVKKYYSFICSIAHLKNTKVVTLVHDLGTFRRRKLTATKEMKRLNQADYIIALNDKMAIWLKENGYKGETGTLDIWDYLSVDRNCTIRKEDNEKYVVNYAGALNKRKNEFLYDLDTLVQSYSFHLYGNGFLPTEKQKNTPFFNYKGFVVSDEFIQTIRGDFGLVWDGDSIDTCSGDFGVYLQYNNPHKVSLYIRAHLPVIIWREAAMAAFIEKNGVGFVIDSLDEIDVVLASLSQDDYNRMKERVVQLSRQLEAGCYLKKAIREVEAFFDIRK